MSNRKVREILRADPMAMMKAMQKHGVKSIAEPYPSSRHPGFSVVAAPSVEAVNHAAVELELGQWNSVEILMVRAQEEGPKQISSLQPLYKDATSAGRRLVRTSHGGSFLRRSCGRHRGTRGPGRNG